MKNIGISILISMFFWSCDVPVQLDPHQSEARVIIEGQVTNHIAYQYVKVSRSSGFYDTGVTPRVPDATVWVTDDTGNQYNFTHNPRDHADSVGYYLPEVPFAGVVGKTYRLHVDINGKGYEAEDKMYPVTTVDSLTYRENPDEKDDPKDDGKFYEVQIFAKEPQETKDYYLFKFFRNDSLKVYNDTDIYFSDDEVLGENIDGVTSPIFFAPGDRARIEMYSISRSAFAFYNDMQSLLNSDGGLFSQPPSNSRTNLSNGALGFFQVSALDISSVEVK